MPCGLIPGASGGGLFVVNDGELVLVGILSTVTNDLTANGIVPLASLHELLEHPDRYTHRFATAQMRRDHSRSPDVIDHEELCNNPLGKTDTHSHPGRRTMRADLAVVTKRERRSRLLAACSRRSAAQNNP